ncbi:MAG TPA: hypothetical protein VLF18_03400 [Tahibacter sp.]|uniref:hypothetical protein n=1 Tax=Tahibacter sp. TaxID=2056211 RepID=UPI002BB61DE1|nr:hypothetical protein [Tahibacter sp.]HSX59226.1 hypothetical protein [Tahibacter sp.]
MASARSLLVPPNSEGWYHCIQRCVRRSFLCGEDSYTGFSFEHRKSWIEDRLRVLGDCFAISIHAYAVMSNHLHIVLQVVPDVVAAWSDEEVAARWVRIYPPARGDAAAVELKRQQLAADPGRIEVIRSRLGNLSWFMRCLAEPIARRANREDGCTGRFWEGRYKCQVLCNERAVLAAMTYVDLNPVRSGTAEGLDTSKHAGVRARIEKARKHPETLAALLRPIIGIQRSTLSISTADYLAILDWTGRAAAVGKRGTIASDAPAALSMVDGDPERWALRVRGFGSAWARVVGSARDLRDAAERIGQRWLKGVRFALQLD